MFSSLIARREAVYDEKAIPDCGAKSHVGRLLITFFRAVCLRGKLRVFA